jgi:CheY-like chemotaxis protein
MPSPSSSSPSRSSRNPFPGKANPKTLPPKPLDAGRVPSCPHFLIVDDNPDGRFLVAKTILRKFPTAVILECQTAEAAFAAMQGQVISAIVSHRTFDAAGVELVTELRKRNSNVPILMMSGIDRHEDALLAGANAFLTYEQWLLVGSTIEMLLGVPASGAEPRS